MAKEEQHFFEDLDVGHKTVSGRRTITETDIVNFAGLSGDFNPLHVDDEFAKQTFFGQRIAHGLLGLSICSGLPDPEPPLAVIAFLGLEWSFRKPIFIGDTIHFVSEVKSKKEGKKSGRGIIVFERTLLNQKEEAVQQGTFTIMVKKREQA